MVEFKHVSVLLDEVIEGLNIKSDGIYVDGTTGGAGHSYHILSKLKNGKLYCFDQDEQAIEASKKRLHSLSNNNVVFINSNFKNMKVELSKHSTQQVDGILFDLGVSSFQLDEPSRGFSYRFDSPLDMRMNQNEAFSAYDVVNKYSEEKLAKIIFEYGEERYSRQIAKSIVNYRKNKPVETTFELVEIIKKVISVKDQIKFGHPAKRTFQAIRIEVNQELEILRQSLSDALDLLRSGGRCCVITFHSLEDRIVKQLFKEKTSDTSWHRGMPVNIQSSQINFKLVSNKPILPSQEELDVNPRSHSAKLRIIERL